MTTTAKHQAAAEDLPLYPEDILNEGPQGCRRIDHPDGSGAYETPPPPHIARRYEWQAAELKARTAITDLLRLAAEDCHDCGLPGNDNHAAAITATEAIADLLRIHAPESLHQETAHRIQELADRHRYDKPPPPPPTARPNYRR